jgi:hypothetical protein
MKPRSLPKTETLQAYETLAVSGCALTFAGRCGGRINANPARSNQYAARIPNAIDPIDAQISIAKPNKSVIVSACLKCKPSRCASHFLGNARKTNEKHCSDCLRSLGCVDP